MNDAPFLEGRSSLTYRPAEISMLDDIRLDVTDVVKVTLLDGTTIRVPCMTLNQDFTASETKVKAVGNADGEASNYSGPLLNDAPFLEGRSRKKWNIYNRQRSVKGRL